MAAPPVGHALVAGMSPRPEPPSATSPPVRVTIVAAKTVATIALRLPGPRFCPESAQGHAP